MCRWPFLYFTSSILNTAIMFLSSSLCSLSVRSPGVIVINEHGHCAWASSSQLFSWSLLSAVSGNTLSSLISSPVPSLLPQGQLPPTLGPVIYWAPLYCLWLPSGCLSGLRFSQTTASLRIIIRLRPAVWRSSTASLLLIELDPMLEVTEKWTVVP